MLIQNKNMLQVHNNVYNIYKDLNIYIYIFIKVRIIKTQNNDSYGDRDKFNVDL